MFQNFLNNFSKQLKHTKNILYRNANKKEFYNLYFSLLKNPKFQRITNTNYDEYVQHLNLFKDKFNTFKKTCSKGIYEFRKYKPHNLTKDVFNKQKFLNKLNYEKNKKLFVQNLHSIYSKFNNANLSKASLFEKFPYLNKEKLRYNAQYFKDFLNKKMQNNGSTTFNNKQHSENSSHNYWKININRLTNKVVEKIRSKKLMFRNKIKNTTLRLILYFIAFVAFIKAIQSILRRVIYGKTPDEKYDQILQSLNDLQRQNEELRQVNQRLLELRK